MKTSKLIELLREADPTGEVECCTNDNADILFVDGVDSYWDGCLEVLERGKFGSVTRARVMMSGKKVRLCPWTIEEVLGHGPDLPVDLSDLGEEMREHWRKQVESWRAEGRRLQGGST